MNFITKGSGPLYYNFVFLFAGYDYYAAMLGKELLTHPLVRIYKYVFKGNRLEEFLFHLHTAYSINEKFEIPFKSIWFKRMYEQDFSNDLPICFVYVSPNMVRYEGGFIDYVRKQNPDNRIVMLHWDLISKKVKYEYDIIKRKVDLAITYDSEEAKKYGIHYFRETVYSKLVKEPESPEIKWDVYFLGAAKDRLDKLYEIYAFLRENNLKCKFLIAEAPAEKRISGEGIEYIDSITYKKNLHYVIESKCILEVVQGNSSDITTRAKEAMAYGKRLITDCRSDLRSCFHEGQLICFSEVSQIDPDLIRADYPTGGYPPLLDMDPLKRLYDIQEQLEKLNG